MIFLNVLNVTIKDKKEIKLLECKRIGDKIFPIFIRKGISRVEY